MHTDKLTYDKSTYDVYSTLTCDYLQNGIHVLKLYKIEITQKGFICSVSRINY